MSTMSVPDAVAQHRRALAAQAAAEREALELRRLLREARADGVSVVQLASALGVTRQRVYQLLGKES